MSLNKDSKATRQIPAVLVPYLHDPFAYLGLHQDADDWLIRVYAPEAERVSLWLENESEPFEPGPSPGLFIWRGKTQPVRPYRLRLERGNVAWERVDPYQFLPWITDFDLHLFGEGRLLQAWRILGAHPVTLEGIIGVHFAVWAPNASRVSVVGDFNFWDGRVDLMCTMGDSGVWSLFVPNVTAGALYKFEIENRQTGELLIKTDPFGQWFEARPGTASRVLPTGAYAWQDAGWLVGRREQSWLHQPMNIYEVHPGSWKRHPDGRYYTYRELADTLVPYVREMGYTHIEFMPLSEHPLDESWGYQATGYFAPTSRFGTPEDLKFLIDRCHQGGIGVLLDWVPAHFPKDAWALARFDGTALYEHEDPRLGTHQDWGTLIFNYSRNEVRNFLLASANYWLSEFHIDGLRVDAVASMLYLDYSRKAGEWVPNKFGGRENLDAVEFLKSLNIMVHEEFPGAVTIAEESTAWPMVSRPVYLGGLGFSMKWNMGWMNDTLRYMSEDPVYRRYHHNLLTFSAVYAWSENYILPLSHDEVVHGKRSLLDKMPGDSWQKFANLRLLFAFQFSWPGKKLNFMGNEFGQGREWQATAGLEWQLLELPCHAQVQALCRDLNELYRSRVALYEQDFDPAGFQWINGNDPDQSVLSYLRRASDGQFMVSVLNFTPVVRERYRIGVPAAGVYREVFNSDSALYGGSNVGNLGGVAAEPTSYMGYPYSIEITLPPLAGVLFELKA